MLLIAIVKYRKFYLELKPHVSLATPLHFTFFKIEIIPTLAQIHKKRNIFREIGA